MTIKITSIVSLNHSPRYGGDNKRKQRLDGQKKAGGVELREKELGAKIERRKDI